MSLDGIRTRDEAKRALLKCGSDIDTYIAHFRASKSPGPRDLESLRTASRVLRKTGESRVFWSTDFVLLSNLARKVHDTSAHNPYLTSVTGEILDVVEYLEESTPRIYRATRRAAARQMRPVRSAERLTNASVRVLPADCRERYRAELRGELYDIAARGASRRAQVIYAARLIEHAWELRAELKGSRGRWSVKVGVTMGAGGGGSLLFLAGWPGVVDVAIVTCSGLSWLAFVVTSAERTERVLSLIASIFHRGSKDDRDR
jgi:hypothetical protein